MTFMTFLAPFTLLVVGFVASVSAGAARDTEDFTPVTALSALLAAALFLALQALLWVRLGASL